MQIMESYIVDYVVIIVGIREAFVFCSGEMTVRLCAHVVFSPMKAIAKVCSTSWIVNSRLNY